MTQTGTRAGTVVSRTVALAGAAWGITLVTRGPAIWRAVQGSPPTDGDALAIQALAVRHLGQGSLQTFLPTHLRGLWIGVDGLHAATMAVLAYRDPSRRRVALLTGGVAVLSGVGTAISLARSRRKSS